MMASERDPHDIVPDGFYDEFDSLADARRSLDSTGDERGCCPECGRSWIRYRPGNTMAAESPQRNGDENYVCRRCGHTFDEPEAEE
jgi:rubredoxin